EHIPDEIARLRQALDQAAADARETRQRITARMGPALGNIFSAQASVFEDHVLRTRIENLIRAKSYSAEYAVSRGIREYIKKLEEAVQRLGDAAVPTVNRQSAELIDLERQVLANLLGQQHEPPDQFA